MRITLPVVCFTLLVTCAVVGLAPAQVLPYISRGMTGYYYQNAEPERAIITGPYDHKKIDTRIDFRTATFDWKPFGMDQRFSVYWNGWLYIDEKRYYAFSLLANGGAELYIDEVKMVDKPPQPNKRWGTSSLVLLDPGYHRIELIYHNWGGSAGIGLYWNQGEGEYLIPTDKLFPEDAVDPATLQPKQ